MPLLFVAPFVIAAAATAGVVGVPAATIALAENQADNAVRATELLFAIASLSAGPKKSGRMRLTGVCMVAASSGTAGTALCGP